MSTIIFAFLIRITQGMPAKSWTIGVKDAVDYTDGTTSVAMLRGHVNHDVINAYIPWSGRHEYFVMDALKENPTYSTVTFSYGSGNYNRPSSITSIYLIKY